VLDFDELVRTATGLLDDAAIADEITGQWTQVYCDEFQDTDATQFSLLTELTDGPDRPDLLAIGDKDQAIYGWRGTDREGLDRLADAYDDHEAIELELNFRSRQEILDLANACEYGPQSSKTLREDGRTAGTYDEDEPPDRVVKVESDQVPSRRPNRSRRRSRGCSTARPRTFPSARWAISRSSSGPTVTRRQSRTNFGSCASPTKYPARLAARSRPVSRRCCRISGPSSSRTRMPISGASSSTGTGSRRPISRRCNGETGRCTTP